MRKFFCLLALIVLFLDSFEQQASLSDNLLLQRGHNLSVYGLSFSSDGKYLLSAGIEGDVVLWEVARGIEIKRFSGHKFYIYGVQFCNHDSSFLVRDSKGIIYKWDIARKQIIKVLETNCRGNDVGISADGNYVSAVNLDTVRLYETNNFTLLHVYPHFSKVQLSKKVFLMQNDSSLSVVGYKDLDKPSAGKIPKYTNNIYYVTPDENFIGTNNLGTLNLIKIGDTAWKTKTITDVRNMKFANEGNLLVTIEEKRTEMYSKYSSIGIYSLPDGKEIHFIPSSSEVDVMAVSPNGKFVATVSILGQPYDPIEIWDTKTGRLSFQLKANQAEINNFVYDKHTRSMYTTRAYSTFQKWNPYGGEGVVWSGEEMIDRVSFDMQLNSKGDAIAVTHGNSVSVFSTADGSLITKFAIEAVGYITQVRFWPDDDHIIAANTEHNLQIWSIKTGDEVYAGKTGMEVTSILPVSSTEVTLAGTSNMSAHTIQNFIWNAVEQKLSLKDKNVVYTQVLRACTFNKGFLFSTNETGNYEIPRIFVQNSSHKQTGEITGFESFVHAMAVNSNTLIAGDDSGYIYTVDIGNYKITSKKRYSQHSITGIVFFDDTHKAFAVNAATDRYVSIFSFPSLEPIFTMFDNVYGWLMLNPQGYYFGSKNIDDFVYFKQQDHIYSFDQFDLWYNRPDFVLRKLPSVGTNVITAYKAAYDKRIKKMNLQQNGVSLSLDKIYSPAINVSLQDSVSPSSKSINIHIKAFDSISTFKNLLVFVNGVPEQINRREVTSGNKIDTTIGIELSQGDNKIEISVRNNAGIESYKERRMAYQPDTSIHPNLYMLLYGDSKFQNQLYNLKYPSKDAADMAGYFSSASTYYKKVHFILLTNEQCTRQNFIDSMQYIIKHAGVNDNVLLFFGTHGITLDNEYYLATYDINFLKPKDKGINFDLADSLMYLIKSRKKTILIDACQSGEIDKDAVPVLQKKIQMPGLVLRSVGPALTASEKDRKAFTLMKEQFTVLERQSGTTVLAASSGIDAAIESNEWQNGLFTYVVLQGLKSKEADLDRDGAVSIMELKKYTDKKVLELSNGLQQSSTRTENMISDFRIQ